MAGVASCRTNGRQVTVDDEARVQGREEAAPAALLMFSLFVALAIVSRAEGWELLRLGWWIWLVVATPALLLAIDLVLASQGRGMVRSRSAALVLITLLVVANLAAVAILVVGVLTTSTEDLTGAELLTIGVGVWSANAIVFGVLFWELDSGGPAARIRASSRAAPDLLFPQDDRHAHDEKPWRPQAWDYLYVSLTNSIAFSPTDTMPLSLTAKLTMALESGIAAFSVLLVFARAVNVIGT